MIALALAAALLASDLKAALCDSANGETACCHAERNFQQEHTIPYTPVSLDTVSHTGFELDIHTDLTANPLSPAGFLGSLVVSQPLSDKDSAVVIKVDGDQAGCLWAVTAPKSGEMVCVVYYDPTEEGK